MHIVFLGSSHFGLPALQALRAEGCKISCVLTQPDAHSGRGLPMTHTLIKDFSLKNRLKLYQPKSINAPESLEFLRKLKPDLFVVIAYGQILSSDVLSIPKLMAINLHASLLPKYRGAAPINRALLNGEQATGVTVMKVIRKMDAGPIILQESLTIAPQDNYVTIEEKLSCLGAKLLRDAVNLIASGAHTLTEQDESLATFAPKLKKEDGSIDWHQPAEHIHNLVRGCVVWPGAFTHYQGSLLKVYASRLVAASAPVQGSQPGQVIAVTKEGIFVLCGKDVLVIEELQLAGKRRMKTAEFIAGHKIMVGQAMGK
ncbi:MAG TPA: methionyl-tRNA formyltransferase [Patescibacteria group bacterium]|nr:methionyl-tRNA formyltransferase [Patescibacteria group bacterium]